MFDNMKVTIRKTRNNVETIFILHLTEKYWSGIVPYILLSDMVW